MDSRKIYEIDSIPKGITMETSLIGEFVSFSATDKHGKSFMAEGQIVAVAHGKPFSNLMEGFRFLIRYQNEFYERMATDTNQISTRKGR